MPFGAVIAAVEDRCASRRGEECEKVAGGGESRVAERRVQGDVAVEEGFVVAGESGAEAEVEGGYTRFTGRDDERDQEIETAEPTVARDNA